MRIYNLALPKLIQLIFFLISAVLVLRIIFRLFAANPNATFVHWVYITSGTLLEPFRGIFIPAAIGHGYVLDFTALIALLIYALLGAFLAYLAALLEAALTPRSYVDEMPGKKSRR